jgi:hypothetical protein
MKTLGEVAFLNCMSSLGADWLGLPPSIRQEWETSTQAVRAAVIEEIAHAAQHEMPTYLLFSEDPFADMASAIRALKDKP